MCPTPYIDSCFSLSPPLPPPPSSKLLLPVQKSSFFQMQQQTNKNTSAATFVFGMGDRLTATLTNSHRPPRPTDSTEPDFGSDEFEDLTITFYDSAACTNATGTEELTEADLYALFGVEDGTSCSPSGDFGFNTVIHCSDGSPAAVYYEVNHHLLRFPSTFRRIEAANNTSAREASGGGVPVAFCKPPHTFVYCHHLPDCACLRKYVTHLRCCAVRRENRENLACAPCSCPRCLF